jgi:hypothetical protein
MDTKDVLRGTAIALCGCVGVGAAAGGGAAVGSGEHVTTGWVALVVGGLMVGVPSGIAAALSAVSPSAAGAAEGGK